MVILLFIDRWSSYSLISPYLISIIDGSLRWLLNLLFSIFTHLQNSHQQQSSALSVSFSHIEREWARRWDREKQGESQPLQTCGLCPDLQCLQATASCHLSPIRSLPPWVQRRGRGPFPASSLIYRWFLCYDSLWHKPCVITAVWWRETVWG